MRPEDQTYRGQVVRLAELAGDKAVLRDFVFEDCRVKGPAVIVPRACNFVGTSFEGDADAMLWEIPPTRERVIGAILVERCTFENCEITNIGIAGPPDMMAEFRANVAAPPD